MGETEKWSLVGEQWEASGGQGRYGQKNHGHWRIGLGEMHGEVMGFNGRINERLRALSTTYFSFRNPKDISTSLSRHVYMIMIEKDPYTRIEVFLRHSPDSPISYGALKSGMCVAVA